MSGPIEYLEDAPGRDVVDSMKGLVLLEFGNDWCGHCRAAQPHVAAALATARAPVRHLAIADGRGRRLGRTFGVKLWPTLVLLKDGHEIGRCVRPHDAETVNTMLAAANEGPQA